MLLLWTEKGVLYRLVIHSLITINGEHL